MPELPEVETIRADLADAVVGRRVTAVFVHDPAVVRTPSAGAFVAGLKGRTLVYAGRRAKYLLLHLDDDRVWALHLSLEARLLLGPAEEEIKPGTKLAVALDDGRELRLVDPVSYALVALGDPGEIAEAFKLDQLGPEPQQAGFTEEVLRTRMAGRRGMIKPLVLNQRIVAGVGNIYADEALWRARIHPARKANGLTDPEWTALHRALVDTLVEGVANRGTTAPGGLYRDLYGRKGKHQEHLAVFRKGDKPCPRCGTPITRTELGGRPTFFCATCQAVEGSTPVGVEITRAAEGRPARR